MISKFVISKFLITRFVVARFSMLLLALLAIACSTGCMLVDKDRLQKDDEDRIPWNERQDWEHRMMGL